ncbi:MAG TPA: glycosyltransferase N-terminal domain-containing protein [Bacteroidia bacterium]|jgi:3-deoxy-D-manno-octulosonic-acid transferase|nr:glycosyltransferase N-terminal domain-containing protein [Bacteroidia bacterium]HMU19018.1 glycosyltransferase N-terminal domain-containing protein [Bacteroidia bacterium]
MLLLYSIGIRLYHFAAALASPFNAKAKAFTEGRRNLFQKVQQELQNESAKRIWFHCSSYGEYEQGKPVLQQIKKLFPQYKIVLSFFSPSGYKQGAKEKLADYVFYLPCDSSSNARKWLDCINPNMAIFVKYDFWFHYMRELSRRSIPFIYISALFRTNQFFFKWYGGAFIKEFKKVTRFFVQNNTSLHILNQKGITRVEVSGDTRFDRVIQLPGLEFKDEKIESFIAAKKIIVAGSTWPEDHLLLADYCNSTEVKLIMAPHEIHESSYKDFIAACKKNVACYSKATVKELLKADVLIIDKIGMLSKLYRFATITYIGGGFGKGIHNTLEAAVYGKPVIFGSNFQKFEEAKQLLESGGAFTISNFRELKTIFDELLNNNKKLEQAGEICQNVVKSNAGATMIITNWLQNHLH